MPVSAVIQLSTDAETETLKRTRTDRNRACLALFVAGLTVYSADRPAADAENPKAPRHAPPRERVERSTREHHHRAAKLQCCDNFHEIGRLEARTLWSQVQGQPGPASKTALAIASQQQFRDYAESRVVEAKDAFFRGRYNRSRARLPENIERWRAVPDIANPGPDLANFPNSAFTLPAGRAYMEISPFTFYGSAQDLASQYNAEYLLRYGLTDDIELRLFGNGVSWSGNAKGGWGFAPIAFDTKIQLWTEKPDYFLPAAGLEAYLLTQWLGTAPFNAGTQPSVTFNFDQSLPFEVDFEYNLGATRVASPDGSNVWEFSFQWALQRDLFDKDFAVFIHGFFNAMTLPRLPANTTPQRYFNQISQDAVGAGFIWTANSRLAVYGQVSAGTTKFTPSTISMLGFALSF